MQYKIISLLLSALVLMTLLPSCGLFRTADAAEDRVEDSLDSVEDIVEGSFAPTPAPGEITPQQAEEIALSHADFTSGEVQGLRTEYDIDDGLHRYEVQFSVGAVEYEYEIGAANGEILSFDVD